MQYILSLILFFSFISITIGAESSNSKDSDTKNILVKDQQIENSNESEIITACLQGDLSSFLTEFEKNKQIINNILSADNEPIIISAVKGGNYKIVKVLLDHGVDIHSINKNKSTPLHLAAYYGHYKTVDLLLEAGADIHKQGEFGYTPLCYATQQSHDEIIQLLFDKGANLEHQDCYNRTPLLIAAYFSNKKSTVKKLLELGANINHQNRNKNTALHLAMKNGNYDVIKFLLDNEANINYQNKYKNTPLHLAALEGHDQIVKLLLEYKADIHKKGNLGYIPLCHACQEGHDDVIQLLVDSGANVNYKDFRRRTPLFLAAYFSNKKNTVTTLCKLGADPTKISTFQIIMLSKDMRKHLNTIAKQQTTIEKKQSESIKNTLIKVVYKKNHDEVIQLTTI